MRTPLLAGFSTLVIFGHVLPGPGLAAGLLVVGLLRQVPRRELHAVMGLAVGPDAASAGVGRRVDVGAPTPVRRADHERRRIGALDGTCVRDRPLDQLVIGQRVRVDVAMGRVPERRLVVQLDVAHPTRGRAPISVDQIRHQVAHVPLPVVPSPDVANRLMLRATGSSIEVTLDGQPVLEATDGRYPRGLIAIGSVTWSDPVAVTFDHVQVTVPAP